MKELWIFVEFLACLGISGISFWAGERRTMDKTNWIMVFLVSGLILLILCV